MEGKTRAIFFVIDFWTRSCTVRIACHNGKKTIKYWPMCVCACVFSSVCEFIQKKIANRINSNCRECCLTHWRWRCARAAKVDRSKATATNEIISQISFSPFVWTHTERKKINKITHWHRPQGVLLLWTHTNRNWCAIVSKRFWRADCGLFLFKSHPHTYTHN